MPTRVRGGRPFRGGGEPHILEQLNRQSSTGKHIPLAELAVVHEVPVVAASNSAAEVEPEVCG